MAVMVGLFLMGGVSIANAVVLVPGSAYVNTTGVAPATYGTLVATSVGAINFAGMVGTITQEVRYTAAGYLFVYRVQNQTPGVLGSGNGIDTLNTANFAGFTDDAGYDPAANTPVLYPIMARLTNAGALSAIYSHDINSGEEATFYVQTNAPFITNGKYTVSGLGQSQDFNGYAPTATPEPGTAALLGTGLLGLLGFRRKKSA